MLTLTLLYFKSDDHHVACQTIKHFFSRSIAHDCEAKLHSPPILDENNAINIRSTTSAGWKITRKGIARKPEAKSTLSHLKLRSNVTLHYNIEKSRENMAKHRKSQQNNIKFSHFSALWHALAWQIGANRLGSTLKITTKQKPNCPAEMLKAWGQPLCHLAVAYQCDPWIHARRLRGGTTDKCCSSCLFIASPT